MRELESLLRAIVFFPSAPVLLTDKKGTGAAASSQMLRQRTTQLIEVWQPRKRWI
jgi:hypothetical protein